MTEERLKFWEEHSDAGGRELTAEIRRSWARIAELEEALYRIASSTDTDRAAAMARGVLG